MKVYVNMPADISTDDGIQKMAKTFLKANAIMLRLGHQAFSIMQGNTTWVESKQAEAFVRCSLMLRQAELIYNADGWESCPICVATQAMATACGIPEVVLEEKQVDDKTVTTVEEAWARGITTLNKELAGNLS